MTLKHINFGDSPVMRELERRAIKRETFQPQVEEIVKQAALSPKYATSNDLYNDMFVLAQGLRRSGFETEASALEEKVILFKRAETHLYRAIDEDGEDILEFAHPDGDASVAEAKDGHGEVETGLSAHQKIIEMLSKQPTGKMSSILLNTASSLGVKTAQVDFSKYLNVQTPAAVPAQQSATPVPTSGAVDTENSTVFRGMVAELVPFLKTIANSVLMGHFPEYNSLLAYASNPPVLGITSDSKKAVLEDFKSRFSALSKFSEGSSERDQVKLAPGAREAFTAAVQNCFAVYNKVVSFVSKLTGDKSVSKLENQSSTDNVTLDQLKSVTGVFSRAVRLLENWKLIAAPNDIGLIDKYIAYAMNYINGLSVFVGDVRYGAVFSTLVKIDPRNSSLTSLSALASAANTFLNTVRNLAASKLNLKAASVKLTLNKKAFNVEEEVARRAQEVKNKTAPPPSGAPAQPGEPTLVPGTPAPSSSDQGAKPAAAPASTSQTRLSDEEKKAVQGMQLALFTLGQYANTYQSKLGDQAMSLVPTLMRMGKGKGSKATKDQFDGAWGTNTAAALQAAQTIMSSWGSKKAGSPESLQIGPMMGRSKHTAEAAMANTNIINQFIRGAFGGQANEQDGESGKSTDLVLDDLPQMANLTSTGSPDKVTGSSPVVKLKLSDIKNLNSLYNFLVANGLEAPEQFGASESSLGYEGFAISKWNGIIQWFKKRAVFKYNLFGRQDQGMEGFKQNAKTYYNYIVNLENQFKSLFTSLLRTSKDKENFGAYIVPEDLISQMSQRGGGENRAGGKELGGAGSSRNSMKARVNSRDGQYSAWQEGVQGVQEGRSVNAPPGQNEGSPVSDRLNLERLGILDDSLVYPIINFNQFRANAIDLANSLINESEAGMPAVTKFQQFLVSLYNAIQASAAEWSRSGEATDEEVEASSKWSNAWAQMIRKKLDQIKRWRASGGK